ncbi:type I restriction-modification system DNA methylase subunit [Ereboglobus sp. PH5-10]|uniref:N-6 DNA methylase n=1 Tax=Ereboglobus sp. PH5-10 TaxID=2940629 RepID=UPI002404F501|nr:N-6 DNA methylase [Ereboglobus sp. PH5-10]MDF9828580.1 type I restriction-modification system DNA methylase subunit [Ereboglobus sp. PH5-10]
MKNKTAKFRSLIEQLIRYHDAYKVFSAFTTLAACALAHGTREAEYLEEAKRWKKDELNIFSHALAALVLEMEDQPFTDLLGGHYMELALSHKSQQWNGEFHTPQNVCEMIGHMIAGDTTMPQEGPITLCEPACGAGAMILAFAKMLPPENRPRLRVTAIDISKTACDMCFINTTLWGIPAEIIHGNTLSMELFASWKNIHWIMRGTLHLLAPARAESVANGDSKVGGEIATPIEAARISSEIKQQGQPPSPEKTEQIKMALGQQIFDFA